MAPVRRSDGELFCTLYDAGLEAINFTTGESVKMKTRADRGGHNAGT